MSQEVLIVEDDRALARQLVRVVESAGYLTRLAHDGEAAMREVSKAAPDLVLLDLLLPKKDGHKVLSVLKNAASTREIPVLAMSGIFRGRERARELEQEGAVGFLEKPFASRDLIEQLHAILGAPQGTAPSESEAERPSLAEKATAEVLWEEMQRGLSGAVHFQSGKRHKVVMLEAGQPRFIRSNIVRECLGRRLFDAGRIDEKALDESQRRAKNSSRKQGGVLMEMGLLTAVELEQALATQAEEKLLDLFSWKQGESWTQPGAISDALASPLEGWTPRRVILRGLEMADPQMIEAKLAEFGEHRVVREELDLSDAEKVGPVSALLKALGEDTSVADLMTRHGLALYGLWLVGSVRFDAKGLTQDQSGEHAKLRQKLEMQSRQTYFEVLGVKEGASVQEVRGAFVKLAKHYHPDRFGGRSVEAARLAAEIFSRISTAHDTLMDAEARNVYLSELRTGKSAKEQRREVNRIMTAEKECRRGEQFLSQREYAEAVKHFQRALDFDSSEGAFHAFYGWALFLAQQGAPEAKAEAVQHLETGINLAPQSPTGYYYLGQLRKACGEAEVAMRMFRKVLSVRPDHVEAARELNLLMRRRQQEDDDTNSGGLFGFGRKKK